MISSLDIENFKCFDHLRLSFRPLSLLTGFNGAGKSSAIQPLLVLAQALRRDTQSDVFALNGQLVRLGTVGDVVPVNAGSARMVFTVSADAQTTMWAFSVRAGERALRVAGTGETSTTGDSDSGDAVRGRITKSLADLVFISAVRAGTNDLYPTPGVDSERRGDVGVDGCFAAFWYDRLVDEPVPIERRHPRESAASLRKQLDAWFGVLFPGAQANVEALPHFSALGLQFRLSETGEWRRPVNVGYGLTYAFPILVSLLTAQPGQSVVIDSPEAHLHPRAQSEMGKILAHFAAAGVQVIVETHSDHLLNGVRLAVREAILPASDLALHFFGEASKGRAFVTTPTIDGAGQIDEWPKGFFDQAESDLAALAGWD